MSREITLAVTGASGAPYALHFLRAVMELGHRVNLVVSPAGERVLRDELPEDALQAFAERPGLRRFKYQDIGATIASGSRAPDAMVVLPASMGTVAKIRAGIAGNLIERAADVMLKEGRPLLLVPRETPFNVIHLENMLALARTGAIILPAMPGFYHRPENLSDLYAFLTGRILDRLGIANSLAPRWLGDTDNSE